MDLFLLIGQSNMAGRGIVAEEDTAVHDRVMTLSGDGEWVPAVDPIHFDKPIAGVGPGRSIGIAIAEANPTVRVGLIPAAVGGSPIASWEPGAVDSATATHPYDDALARTRRALQDGMLRAILWHQGESDSNERAAPVYRERLVALIERLRTEFGNPELPFIIGQLGRFDGSPWSEGREMVDAAHQSIAAEMENVHFVSAEGLGDKGDDLHFSAEAARELGRRFAAAFLASR
jgi:hypothetical protein